MKKKCSKCGELRSLKYFYYELGKPRNDCSLCKIVSTKKRFNTKIGFLQYLYTGIKSRGKKHADINHQCYFTFKEFCEAFEKHEKKYGMNSAWGPHYLPMTMIYQGRTGKSQKGLKNLGSNMSPDRLDSSKPYTIQNLIFIRSDENKRKKDSTYEDCIAHIKLHEERFITMRSI